MKKIKRGSIPFSSTKNRNMKSQGLGDSVEKFTEITGIKKITQKIFGEDCGCKERKEMLNKRFSYNNKNANTSR